MKYGKSDGPPFPEPLATNQGTFKNNGRGLKQVRALKSLQLSP